MNPRLLRFGALACGLALWGYVGWDSALWDPRLQFALHAGAAAALGLLIVVAWRGGELPATRLDLPILALLVVEGVATLSAWNPGLSARALAAMLATAAMLPVALLLLRHAPRLSVIVVVLPIIGLAAGTLGVLVWRRVEWMLAGGPGWPPVRLPHEGTPFGSVAVPPFVIMAALPLVLLLADPRLRRWLAGALLAVGIPLTVLSGSRSAWIAISVALLVVAGPLLRSARFSAAITARRLLGGAALLAVAVAALIYAAPRLTASGSVTYREALWRATIDAWRVDPLLGIGPGSMPYARQQVSPLLQLHSHDVPLGILGDAGVVGLLAALALFVTFVWVARPRSSSTAAGRASYAVLIGLAVGFLTEDLTFLPNFNLLIVALVAVALTDAGAVRWRSVRVKVPLRVGTVVAGIALAALALFGDAAAIAYRAGTDAAAAGSWPDSAGWLSLAVRLDPWQPTGAKSLTVAADRVGDPRSARRSAERAVQLNSGDWTSWLNLALICRMQGDAACASGAAGRAMATSSGSGLMPANAALIYEAFGERRAADAAFRRSLLSDWRTSLVVHWPRRIDLGAQPAVERGQPAGQLNLLVARRTGGEPLRAAAYASPAIQALAFAMTGDRAAARGALSTAKRDQAADPMTWEIAALLARHWGENDATDLRVAEVTRGSPQPEGVPTPASFTADIVSLRYYPGDGLVQAAERLTVSLPWPWVLESLLAP